jgi:hypothetical protein
VKIGQPRQSSRALRQPAPGIENLTPQIDGNNSFPPYTSF